MIEEHLSLRTIARNQHTGRERVRRRFHVSARALSHATALPPPPETTPLIAIADALHSDCEGVEVSLPIILLRSVRGTTAHLVVLDVLPGGESLKNWQQAFSQIPKGMHRRIVALVSDDNNGLMGVAQRQGWVHQVCTFHVKSRFQHWLPRKRKVRYEREIRTVWNAVRIICDDQDRHRVGAALRTLKRYDHFLPFPTLLQLRVRGLLKRWRSCRTYLTYPERRLPDTSNAVESVAGNVREMLAKRRGFRSVRALRTWLHLFQKLHPTVTCNGAKNLQN